MANILDTEVLHRLGHGRTESLEDVRHVEASIATAQKHIANILDNEVLHRLGHGCTESLEDVRHVEAGIAMAQSNVSFSILAWLNLEPPL